MIATTNAQPLIAELVRVGIIPPNCYKWSLHLDVGGVASVKYEVFITEAQFQTAYDLLMANATESVIADVIAKTPDPLDTRQITFSTKVNLKVIDK